MDLERFGPTISSTTHKVQQLSEFLKEFVNVGIVSNDTGCSNTLAQIARIIANTHTLEMYFSGPAIKIFEGVGLRANNKEIRAVIDKSELVITGTGWQSQAEQLAMKEAFHAGKSCFVVLDHWQDFHSRFEPTLLERNFPTLLIVTNTLAYFKAQQELPNIPCIQIADLYLESLIEEYTNKLTISLEKRNQILYLSNGQPFDSNSPFDQLGQLKSVSELFDLVEFAEHKSKNRIFLRPHPADKFPENLSQIRDFGVEVVSGDLLTQFLRAELVVASDTYALYLAMKLGIPTITVIDSENMPDWLDFAPSIGSLKTKVLLRRIFFGLLHKPVGPVYFRYFSVTDIDDLHLNNLNDFEHMRFSRASIGATNFLDALHYSRQINSEDGFHLAIVNRKHERVGSCTVIFNQTIKRIELGILIYREFSRQKLGSYAWKFLANKLQTLFLGYKVWAGTLKDNIAMRNVLESSSFVLIKKEFEDYFSQGTQETILIFEYRPDSNDVLALTEM